MTGKKYKEKKRVLKLQDVAINIPGVSPKKEPQKNGKYFYKKEKFTKIISKTKIITTGHHKGVINN